MRPTCLGCRQQIATYRDHGFADRNGNPAPARLLAIADEDQRAFALEAEGYGYCIFELCGPADLVETGGQIWSMS